MGPVTFLRKFFLMGLYPWHGLQWARKRRGFKPLIGLISILSILHYFLLSLFFHLAFRKRLNHHLARALHHARKRREGFRRRYSPEYVFNLHWMKNCPTEHWSVVAKDGSKLGAQFFRSAKNPQSKRVALVAHGYRGSPSRVAHFAQFYYESMGYHVLCPTARAHGNSDGELISFGWLEKDDIEVWFAALQEEFGPGTSVVLHGVSMGGSTVLMGASSIPQSALVAVVADSSFTSLQEAFYHHFTFFPRSCSDFILGKGDNRFKSVYGFSLFDIEVLKYVEKIEAPLLIVHGEQDHVAPFKMALEIYERARSHKKRLLSVAHARHADSWFVNQRQYAAAIHELLEA